MAFLSDENRLNYFTFLTDIRQYLPELNLKLQGKSQNVNKLFQHICAVEKKIEQFLVQLGRATLTNFTCLAVRKIEFPDFHSTYCAANVQMLHDVFTGRFP